MNRGEASQKNPFNCKVHSLPEGIGAPVPKEDESFNYELYPVKTSKTAQIPQEIGSLW